MKISKVIEAIECLAPLALQEDYDNSGIQVCCSDDECTGVLVCLDITEDVVGEAVRLGCNLVVSHHPLLFSPLRHITTSSYQERCVVKAVRNGISLYSAHTNLDNAEGGVNYRIASLLGIESLQWLEPKRDALGNVCGGSGVIGVLKEPVADGDFISRLSELFGVECVLHTALSGRTVSRVAVCGGAGSFLIPSAEEAGADCFVTGEISYHHYFDVATPSSGRSPMLLAALGHYQSEQYTKDLIRDCLAGSFPDLRVELTSIDTNPIHYTKR